MFNVIILVEKSRIKIGTLICVIGIGTVIAMLSTGPFIQLCLPYGENFVNLIVNQRVEETEEDTAIA
ncbi:hypothetical protein ACJDTP_23510 [Clostridium sp. WILCCON 0112]|uniref:Uncharacterized protein n=1 Tax=Candidatus Clostridium helianthi TaxID=3381660 RepID=A0ABW8SD29_9CLOT